MEYHIREKNVDLHRNFIITVSHYALGCYLSQNTDAKDNLNRNKKQAFIEIIRLLFCYQVIFLFVTHSLSLKNSGAEIDVQGFNLNFFFFVDLFDVSVVAMFLE